MYTRLTNCGHRYITQRMGSHASERDSLKGDARALYHVLNHIHVPATDSSLERKLIERGLLELVPEDTSYEETQLRYERNPLEHVHTINFELTTKCNLHCLHCRSGIVKRTTETDIEALKDVAEQCMSLGFTGFTFIGGEVSKYATGWQELTRHIKAHYEAHEASIPSHHWGGLKLALLTSGWWLEQEDFQAAEGRYANDEEYMQSLIDAGLTHLIFSVDGPEPLHDRWRQVPGLYQRIIRGIPRVRAAGLMPKVSLVLRSGEHDQYSAEYLIELAELLYNFPADTGTNVKLSVLMNDSGNLASNFIDINNGVQLSQSTFPLAEIPTDRLRCKAFFRPSPKLTISASGELAICPLMNAAEKYGNIHKRPLTTLLNTMHDNFIFQLHAEQRIKEYLPMMDTEIFGDAFDHLCSLRTILNLLAKKMHEAGLTPDGITAKDQATLKQINLDVARWTGHLKLLAVSD